MSYHYPIKIASIAGRGLGIIATQSLKPGTLILQEQPLVRVNKSAGSPESRANPTCIKLMERITSKVKTGEFHPHQPYNTWPSDIVTCFEGILEQQANMAYDKLDVEMQQKWMELADVQNASLPNNDDDDDDDDDDDKESHRKTPVGILRTNAFDDATNHANLYYTLSRMNHSCAPNAVRLDLPPSDDAAAAAGGGVAVVASKPIEKEEEILINYIDGVDDGLPLEERRKNLMESYHFHCTCDLCTQQEKSSG